jgi:hypothetical protein
MAKVFEDDRYIYQLEIWVRSDGIEQVLEKNKG